MMQATSGRPDGLLSLAFARALEREFEQNDLPGGRGLISGAIAA
jgi:hypothetical protein